MEQLIAKNKKILNDYNSLQNDYNALLDNYNALCLKINKFKNCIEIIEDIFNNMIFLFLFVILYLVAVSFI